ncbi:MAG: PPOX class F420-dependent oxidoreductase [Candidatus Rokuibacteriota bacterium]
MGAASELDRHRYVSLSTFRRNGVEVATPVWFAAAGAKLYVFTAGDSGKVKRLRHTSRARVAPSDGRGLVQGASQPATARLVSEPGVIEQAHAALRAKYGWPVWVADVLSRLTGRIRRRAWIEIDVEPKAGASTNRHA